MSDHDGAACDPSSLVAAAFTRCAVSGVAEHCDPCNGVSDVLFAEWNGQIRLQGFS
jgi:hypothetical protein